MRLANRITKLERLPRYDTKPCPWCGTIDFETGTGTYQAGCIWRTDEQGLTACMCKWCARGFKARLEPTEHPAVFEVTEARPLEEGEWPI